MDGCPVCGQNRTKLFSATVLGKYNADYFLCSHCGLIQPERPTWLDEAYADGPWNLDTGVVDRNILITARLTTLFSLAMPSDGVLIDIGGGHGMLTRMMRDAGFDCLWTDKYAANILARGFEAPNDLTGPAALLAMEVMEHIYDPVAFLSEHFEKRKTKTIVFSTLTYRLTPPGKNWWYYGFESGQHVSFYTTKSLDELARKTGARYYPMNDGFHLITDGKPNETLLRLVGSNLFCAAFYAAKRVFQKSRTRTVSDLNLLKERFDKEKKQAG